MTTAEKLSELRVDLIHAKAKRNQLLETGIKYEEESGSGSSIKITYAPLNQQNNLIKSLESKISRLESTQDFDETGGW